MRKMQAGVFKVVHHCAFAGILRRQDSLAFHTHCDDMAVNMAFVGLGQMGRVNA